jgi:hypothetical protein
VSLFWLVATRWVQGGVTLADREPGLAEMPRPVLFVFGASNFSGWDFFLIFRRARMREATCCVCAKPPRGN